MDIRLRTSYGHVLIIEAENVKIEEDIESRKYFHGADGKIDYSIPPKRDIDTRVLEMFTSVYNDMICYRVEKFDSGNLIEDLFDMLPSDKQKRVLSTLNSNYEE